MKDKCNDCTNSKGCINCENGELHEVKKKKPEGALKDMSNISNGLSEIDKILK